MAAAFGVNHRRQAFLVSGVSAAYAGVAGAYIALISTLAPTQIWAWVGVVFAVVIIGGLANPIGALSRDCSSVSESLTMAVVTPAWARSCPSPS
jgi:branched-chain amino acid transport system permease protein